MDTPTEPKEVIAHEFDQDINTHPPPKLKRTIRERGTKLNITMDTATELQPSEAEEVITHEFGQDINTQPPPKLKRKQIDEGVVKRIDEGVKKNTHLTRSCKTTPLDTTDNSFNWCDGYHVEITEQGIIIVFKKPTRSIEQKVVTTVAPSTFGEMFY